jgi:hypothetical protein
VICVYLFWSGFLRGQRTILDMPPALPTMSRNQCAPVIFKILSGRALRKLSMERSSRVALHCSNANAFQRKLDANLH